MRKKKIAGLPQIWILTLSLKKSQNTNVMHQPLIIPLSFSTDPCQQVNLYKVIAISSSELNNCQQMDVYELVFIG